LNNKRFISIKSSINWINIQPLNKGWSKDEKYIVTDNQGDKYLLRISSIELYESKNKQFYLLKEIENIGINASRVIDFGILNEKEIYMLLTWLDGESAEEVVSKLSNNDAYILGIEAGKILYKLHSIPIDNVSSSWWDKYQKKMPIKIENINKCELEFPEKELVVDYVKNNMFLVENRKQSFSHGDFHVGNMIVKDGKIGIIDFDKNTIADPYDEFKPFCWNVFVNEYFETGLINGYFNNNIPKDFFPILALYAAESLISHLPWAITYGEDEVKTAYTVIKSVMKWYDNFKLVIPTWYKGVLNI